MLEPRGTFTPYSPGTNTNVVFFTKGRPTEEVWVYDGRSNVPAITKKDRPLTPAHFAQFERCYGPDPNGRARRDPTDSPEDRWRRFSIVEVKERDYKIDSLKWLKDDTLDDPDGLPEPEELAADAIAELEGAIDELNSILAELGDDTSLDRPHAPVAVVP
jgi:type I restriction enzyme M protein